MSSTLSHAESMSAPVIKLGSTAGELVGFVLQNTGSTALAAQPVTLNEVFLPGAVPKGSGLTATIGGVTYQAQLDAKTFNADGSVASGIVTLVAPALAAGASSAVMLNLASASNAAPVDLLSALSHYSLTAALTITANAGGSVGSQTVNIANAIRSALAANTAQSWLSGPLASEAIVSIPVSGSLRIEADVTAFANGQISATLQFNNDAAMQAAGGTVRYSATVTQNGITVGQQNNLTQYQYQDWSMTTGTTPSAAGLNVQHNIGYLEATGAIPNFDTQFGAANANITAEQAAINAPGWNAPLGTDQISQFMPATGGRGDIGPTTQGNATWLITQNGTAAAYALGQATEAGSIPWHFYDPTSNGSFLNTGDYANIWTDRRGGPSSYTTGLTQQVNATNSGWTADPAHMPDLNYVTYMLTGNVVALEALNAQASFAIDNFWPSPRMNGQAVVASPGNQTRASAWSLRAVQEAAYANPAGSADKAYFTAATNANYSYLVSLIPQLTIQEGQAHGYLPGAYGNHGARLPPWEQDYLASTVVQGAEMGNANAVTFLKWESNFLVGRFFAAAQGFSPRDGIAYNLAVGNQPGGLGSAGNYYQTWAQIEQATQATGQSNVGNNWTHSGGDYGALALQSLAGIITVSVTHPTIMGNYQYQAMQAFGWLLNSGAPFTTPAVIAADNPQFLIVPRLANGQLLSYANMVLGSDQAGAATALIPINTANNALLYAGNGADTLIGGSAINLMFGGAGNDVIFGGANGNDIFAGSGNDTIIAGGGATYIQASSTAQLTTGTGQDLFVLNSGATGAATIAGFNPSLDRLDIVNANGTALSNAQLNAIEASAVSVAGGVQMRLSPQETLFVAGASRLSPSWFSQQNQAISAPASLIAAAEANNSVVGAGGGASSPPGGTTGSTPPSTTPPFSPPAAPPSSPPASPPTTAPSGGSIKIITSGNAQTILGGNGGSAQDTSNGAAINAQQTGRSDFITLSGSNNTVNAEGGAGHFATYGNITIAGAKTATTVTGGNFVQTGAADTVVSPYNFGALTISEDGTGGFARIIGSTQTSIGGSANSASVTVHSGSGAPMVTLGGSDNTVQASVYSTVLVTGSGDLLYANGETAVTVAGAAKAPADTIIASSFNTIHAESGANVISVVGGSAVMPNIITAQNATTTIALGANAHASISGIGATTITDSMAVRGHATIAGFNASHDQISIQNANGSALTAAQIANLVHSATVKGSTATFDLSGGATLTLVDLAGSPGIPETSWFVSATNPTSPPPLPSPQQIISGTSRGPAVDPLSNAAIDARRLSQSGLLTISGSGDTINAQGGPGGFGTQSNMTIAGSHDRATVTGGNFMQTGAADSVVSPYSFGPLGIMEDGTAGFASIAGSARVSVGGSANSAMVTVQSGGSAAPMVTLGGSANTVHAGVYSTVLLTGSRDLLYTSGNAAVTVNGAVAAPADTIVASGFDAILTNSGDNAVSIPGGSWNSTITNQRANDTISAGASAPGGGNRLLIYGGSGTLVVTDMNSGRTITMTAGSGAVTATGAANGSIFIGGSNGRNELAASGNSTLIGNGASNTITGGGGNELLVASTVSGAQNSFMFNSLTLNAATTISGIGAPDTRDTITLQSGLSITQATTTGISGTMLTLNDGSKLFLSQVTGPLQMHGTTLTFG